MIQAEDRAGAKALGWAGLCPTEKDHQLGLQPESEMQVEVWYKGRIVRAQIRQPCDWC